MTMKSVTNTYASNKEILQFPDDYVARPQFFDEQSSLAVKENGRYIIKAGTPFPSNDTNCTGIVLNDYDVTDGDVNGAVLVRGHINTAKAEENAGITYATACKTAFSKSKNIIYCRRYSYFLCNYSGNAETFIYYSWWYFNRFWCINT